ncbi:MAG: plasmid pRiA4b ORF-3 family protein [Chloroflexi bacterium]|nr:plasmid pRiA4b ORF-3 family protein [Chloroflexota bacterium]
MPRRKLPKTPTSIRQGGRELVLMGDVRQAPIEVREDGRVFSPVVALWVRADDGYVVGQLVDKPGHPAQTLVQALLAPIPVPGQPQAAALPSRVVLFNEELAKQAEPILAPLNIEITISPPFEPFEDLFANLFAQLEQSHEAGSMLDLPDDILRPLISAAERLWRAKPWEYTFDYPPFALMPGQGIARPLYACVLGAEEEVFGVALYTSIEDFETTLMIGESATGLLPEAVPLSALEEAAAGVMGAFRGRVFLVSFGPKDEAPPAYREQLAQCGWSRRLRTVPTFAAMGGGQEPGLLSAEEATEVTIAVDSLVTFCQRHRKQIADEELPIRDAVDVSLAERIVRVDVSVPGEDPTAPPATVFRFKVSLTYQKDVWRTIDVRSDQNLEDLHYAIQDAFGWDDDHLYAFFLSGKAWDVSTEYIRPEGREPGQRSARARLDRLGLRPRKRFLYIFDFGDERRHHIRVEKTGLTPDKGEYPRIVEEHGEAPPQYSD